MLFRSRLNGGPIHILHALPAAAEQNSSLRRFQAVLPARMCGILEYLPILLCNGKPISPPLSHASSKASILHFPPLGLKSPGIPKQSSARISAHQCGPLWHWDNHYLGSLKGQLRKELVGPTPSGLRINWHIVKGSFVGPNIEATICPGTTDWMHILQNGIGVVDVKATFRTTSGHMIYGSYGGIFDLGPDGYQRVLENEEDSFPTLVVTPTYATAAHELAWLNRVQCIGVGRVDTRAEVVSFDVYRISVGERLDSSCP